MGETWDALKLTSRKIKGNFSINQNGQVVIGKGITEIEIFFSTAQQIDNLEETFRLGLDVVKNEDWSQSQRGSYSFGKNLISCELIGIRLNVSEGDKITFYTSCSKQNYTIRA